MKNLIFIFFTLISVGSYAHESFFSFAEMEYNELNGRLETTISVTGHDLEHFLQVNKIINGEIENALKDSSTQIKIQEVLNAHFYVDLDPFGQNSTMDGVELIQFHLDGYEFEKTGLLRFYLSAKLSHPIEQTFGITYNLLMDNHPEQQNKLTFIYREKKSTFVFLQTNQKQFIDLH